jgi:hypothetical protein
MDNRNFDGMRWYKNKDGYWHNHSHGLQHRYVWQQAHQATVDSDDVIHHLDENCENNAIENLKLMSRVDHTRLHMFGNKNCLGYEHSDETKKKMIGNKYALGNKSRLGNKHSAETKLKMSEARKRYWGNRYKINCEE